MFVSDPLEVGAGRFELPTSCTPSKRASRAALRPDSRSRDKEPQGLGNDERTQGSSLLLPFREERYQNNRISAVQQGGYGGLGITGWIVLFPSRPYGGLLTCQFTFTSHELGYRFRIRIGLHRNTPTFRYSTKPNLLPPCKLMGGKLDLVDTVLHRRAVLQVLNHLSIANRLGCRFA
jgi:hypothetical protein